MFSQKNLRLARGVRFDDRRRGELLGLLLDILQLFSSTKPRTALAQCRCSVKQLAVDGYGVLHSPTFIDCALPVSINKNVCYRALWSTNCTGWSFCHQPGIARVMTRGSFVGRVQIDARTLPNTWLAR